MATILGTEFADILVGTADGDSIFGFDGNDKIRGLDGADALFGGDGNDIISGGNGDDYIDLGVGDDTVLGGPGSDSIHTNIGIKNISGGSGFDTLEMDRTTSTGDVTFFLNGAIGSDGTSTISIEQLTYLGGSGADLVVGGVGKDSLSGGAGADTLDGGGGADFLSGGADADYLDGGAGFDYALYQSSGQGVVVNLSLHQGLSGEANGDSLWYIEGIIGCRFSDTLIGDDGNNSIYGGYGGDTIYGLGGNDFISADGGEVELETVRLYGDDGNDTIVGSEFLFNLNSCELYGGNGNDEIYNGNLVYAGTGDDYVYGGKANSTIYGEDGKDEIEATYGNHIVYAGAGNDYVWTEALHGGFQIIDLGADNDVGALLTYSSTAVHQFDGGDGIDTFYFDCSGPSETTRVQTDVLDQISGADQYAGVVAFANFEKFIFLLGGNYNDVMRLGALADTVGAAEGNDYVLGRGGNDFLDGMQGADRINGGRGNDVVMSGANNTNGKDIAHGGAGDDAVYGSFSEAEYFGASQLYGDSGADVFAFVPVGAIVPDQIMDLDPAEDRIALYFSMYFFVDPAAHSFDAITPLSVSDTTSELQFVINARVGEIGYEFHDIAIRYIKESGDLSWKDISLPIDEWHTICNVLGAPDLGVGNFLTIAEFGLA